MHNALRNNFDDGMLDAYLIVDHFDSFLSFFQVVFLFFLSLYMAFYMVSNSLESSFGRRGYVL
jgi:hypothetical protein